MTAIGYPSLAMVNRLTAAEMAERLGVNKSRALKLIRDGRIPAIKLGSQWTVKPSDVAKFKRLKPGRPPKPKPRP